MKTSTTADSARVLCPFFVSHNARDIICEGYYARSCNRMVFQKDTDKDQMKEKRCEGAYQRCIWYQLLMATKYKE